jgi:hypothetical protein
MTVSTNEYRYFTGNSFSDLYTSDVSGAKHAFVLQYPCTASWAYYPNTRKYFIQDGSREETKVGYDKLCQKEPWKIMAVLGNMLPGVMVRGPRDLLVDYWRDTFGHRYDNMLVLERSVWCDFLNQHQEYEKLLTLFPYDRLAPAKHAVDPEAHYRLLSKSTLSEMDINVPDYRIYDLRTTPLEEIDLPNHYPYLIKTTHGLSGEGTYIIRRVHDVEFCFRELRHYLQAKLVTEIIVSDFVKNEIANYCVQFYVDKQGHPVLLGATSQLVSAAGVFQGGLIRYAETDMRRFSPMIRNMAAYAHQHGYFGVIGLDVLEDRDGQLHCIDANIRVNGSTPLCLQRHHLMSLGKNVAKFSSGYLMEGTLDDILVSLKPFLDRHDLIILSALEKAKYGKIYCEIYGIVAGETLEDMQKIEASLGAKGLHLSD